jgi:hypothetical protein
MIFVMQIEDMGHQVNVKAADPYILPSALKPPIMRIGALKRPQG